MRYMQYKEQSKTKAGRDLRFAGGDPRVDRPEKNIFLTVCVSLSDLGPSERK